MKQLLVLLLICPMISYTQQVCDDYTHHTAIGISYILPKSISAEIAYFTKAGLTAGVGVAYSAPGKTTSKNETNEISTQTNMLDIFAYAGYRILQVDYKVSAFLNAGCTMGDVNSLQPFVSSKLLFPAGQKAFGFEPFYVFNRGFSGRASIYIML